MPTGTILVVDDNDQVRGLLATLLRGQGHRVVAACDGEQGLKEFALSKPDLVLLDVLMPKLNGYEMCRRLKQDPESRLVPIIMTTGLSDREDRIRGIEAGADDFLNKPLDRSELFARVNSLLKLKAHTDELDRAESVLFALARSIEGKDPYTGGHCERLAVRSALLGEMLGLAPEQILALRRAGIVHDIGKVGVPDGILLKPAPLAPAEQAIMRQHPIIGEHICRPLKSFQLVLPIIRHHHEKFDGSGYPDGLRGEAIPLTARILQMVDVFDALTTERPYKQALPAGEALEIMAQEVARGWWDPAIFRVFCRMLEKETFPQGSPFLTSEDEGMDLQDSSGADRLQEVPSCP